MPPRTAPPSRPAVRLVRDAAFEVMRDTGMTTLFANPGSTEISLLAALPDDFRFVLGLHESSVIGMATGYSLANGVPALALLHTTAGFGNAVGALATARVNRAPLVVVIGQQDRRHLAYEPFLTGRLEGLAGDYPVWQEQPVRAQDVPGALRRARHEAMHARGPALVVVPMDDWVVPADESRRAASPDRLIVAPMVDRDFVGVVHEALSTARAPALVVGAGADDARSWAALVGVAEAFGCPVWQEPFGSRAGFPQTHVLFAGHLPAGASGLRATLTGHDVILVVGTAAFRQYPYESGAFVDSATRVIVVTDDGGEAARSAADLAMVASIPDFCEVLSLESTDRHVPCIAVETPGVDDPAPRPGATLTAVAVFDALAARLPDDIIVVEESPSSRTELQRRLPARRPLGFLSAAMGGLGFAMPAAVGLRMASTERPVVAIVGDGSAMYAPQSLWSAVEYGVGVLLIVLRNDGYAIMDRLARAEGPSIPWPSLTHLDVQGLAQSFGCEAHRITDESALLEMLDAVVPTLASRRLPLVLEVVVDP